MKKPVFFFEGIDPAPSEGHRSDHGAMVVSAATPRVWSYGDVPEGRTSDVVLPVNSGDWFFDPVYARVITHREKASARQWSAVSRSSGCRWRCRHPAAVGSPRRA